MQIFTFSHYKPIKSLNSKKSVCCGCMWRVRVSSRPYFTGITSRLVPPERQHTFLQARKTNGIQQRTLRNKQFNIHNKTGIKINEKHNVRVAFVEIQLWPVKWK